MHKNCSLPVLSLSRLAGKQQDAAVTLAFDVTNGAGAYGFKHKKLIFTIQKKVIHGQRNRKQQNGQFPPGTCL
jgi:hypothetical protein